MRRSFFIILPLALLGAAAFLPKNIEIKPNSVLPVSSPKEKTATTSEPTAATSSSPAVSGFSPTDIGPQPQLPNPPETVKAIYLTAWSAGSAKKINETIDLIKRTELNGVVVDVKDYSGFVSYAMDIPLVKEDGAMKDIRIKNPNEMIKKFHDAGIYVIARVTVFQDPILAKYKPEWAFVDKRTNKTWVDSKGLAWMDPAGKGTRDYVITIAKDAIARGFDEVNFDYVRFASDGTLGNIEYPYWDKKISRAGVIADFFSYLRGQMGSAKISADLFGLATVNHDDLGIGQVIEEAYKYFDFVAPMVYPSHYAPGFIGYQKPAEHPYEVMKYSLEKANARWNLLAHPKSTSTVAIPENKLAKLRPWIQDFNLGATYTAPMVRKEFQAVYDSLLHGTTTGAYAGWLVWDPSNTYTVGALDPK